MELGRETSEDSRREAGRVVKRTRLMFSYNTRSLSVLID